jgi:hypothetical protein
MMMEMQDKIVEFKLSQMHIVEKEGLKTMPVL